jgi:hypothetical protein
LNLVVPISYSFSIDYIDISFRCLTCPEWIHSDFYGSVSTPPLSHKLEEGVKFLIGQFLSVARSSAYQPLRFQLLSFAKIMGVLLEFVYRLSVWVYFRQAYYKSVTYRFRMSVSSLVISQKTTTPYDKRYVTAQTGVRLDATETCFYETCVKIRSTTVPCISIICANFNNNIVTLAEKEFYFFAWAAFLAIFFSESSSTLASPQSFSKA